MSQTCPELDLQAIFKCLKSYLEIGHKFGFLKTYIICSLIE